MKDISFTTSEHQIPVNVVFGKRVRLKIQLDDDGRVFAFAPMRTRIPDIERFVEANYEWVFAQQKKLSTKIRLPCVDEAEQRRRSRIIKTIVREWLTHYDGKKPQSIFVRNMTSRWGSCSSKGNISLNVHLLDVEPELFEYVLIHELSHLYHMNHSKDFWNQVSKYCPDYKVKRQMLRKYIISKS